MILAGGQGSRLGDLTKKIAKPAVPFGGKYRIIDFTLSNCYNSGIDTVGVLTQYQPFALHSYIGTGSSWDLNWKDGGVFMLPPFARAKGGEWYEGTAHAIYQNIEFIDMFDPSYVVVLSGDHIYKMDYQSMLDYHKENGADATIAVIEVPYEEASRFGIMNTQPNGAIIEFEEKPARPKNNLASMGVYIFNWKILKNYLKEDAENSHSAHDFGKNIIPTMLTKGQRMYAYSFDGYWKDVGTVESYWEANMDLLEDKPKLDLYDSKWKISSVSKAFPPHYLSPKAKVTKSIISEGCTVLGTVENSVIFPGVCIGEGAVIRDSIVMPYAKIGERAKVNRAIISRKVTINADCYIGGIGNDGKKIIVVPEGKIISEEAKVNIV